MNVLGRLPHKYVVAVVAVFAIFMELLDTTIVNVAVPTLAQEFDVGSASTIQWVLTGYLLSLAVFIPVSGWAGDCFGTKRVFLFALTTFTTASLLCALAWNIEALITFRLLQGVGGGMLSPVAFAMVWREFPPEERSRAAGIMVVPAAVAPASGPVVGGAIIEFASWHWIFLVNIPIGALAMLLSFFYLREHREATAGRFDAPGFALSAAGLACVLYALAEAGINGFGDPRIIAFGCGGLALLGAFAVVELRTAEPMLDVRILANTLFRACNLAWIVTMFAVSAGMFLMILELQLLRGLTALESGLVIFTMAIGVMLVAQPTSRIYKAVGPRRIILAGLAVSAASTFMLYAIDLETNLWTVRAVMLFRGAGLGMVLVPLQAATYAQVPSSETGRATAVYNATSQVGSSLGVAVSASYLTSRLSHHGAVFGNPEARDAALLAFHDAFLLMGLIALVGIGVAFLIRDADAAATMSTSESVDERTAAAFH